MQGRDTRPDNAVWVLLAVRQGLPQSLQTLETGQDKDRKRWKTEMP